MHKFFWFLTVTTLVGALLPGCGPSYDHVANLNTPNTGIICLGDSITRGYGATPGHDYPSDLSALLGTPVSNAGEDGDTTGDALARLKPDVLSREPRLVIVELGGNDFLQQRPKEETLGNMNAIVAGIVNAGAMAVMVHAKFGLLNDPYLKGMKKIAEDQGAVLVEDALDGILGRPSRMYDQIHPNDAGYALLAERVADVVQPLLEAANAARQQEG